MVPAEDTFLDGEFMTKQDIYTCFLKCFGVWLLIQAILHGVQMVTGFMQGLIFWVSYCKIDSTDSIGITRFADLMKYTFVASVFTAPLEAFIGLRLLKRADAYAESLANEKPTPTPIRQN